MEKQKEKLAVYYGKTLELAKILLNKFNLQAFENNIELTGESYTVFVDQNEEEGTIVADVFMPKAEEE